MISEPGTAVFKGHEKAWRLGNITWIRQLHHLNDGKMKRVTHDDTYLPGHFVYFGTRQKDTDMNGPCQFEFNFRSTITAYQKNRGGMGTVCYKAFGSFVHNWLLYHFVLICLEEDEAYKSYPTITANSTAYFKPPTEKDEASACINIYFIGQYPRLEHVYLAFYFPDNGSKFMLTSQGRQEKLGGLGHKNISGAFCIR